MDDKLLICDRETAAIGGQIVRRVRDAFANAKIDAISLSMDLTVCHNMGHVDLATLRDAPRGDFAHDILGIHQHLDRDTGEMKDCFVPRCRNAEVASA